MKVNVHIQRVNLARFILLLCLAFSVTGYLNAGTHILGSTSLKIANGTILTEMSDLLLDNGGILDNQGTITVKGNLTNNNTSTSNLGTGTYIFSGTGSQTISGPNVFNNVTINNATGVSLTGTYDNTINGTFTLSAGRFTLGSINLLLGTSATVSGTPTSTNMVVPTGTGELRKAFSGTGSFTYPVGDNDGTAEYSPVIANITSGSFNGGDNYLGVNLKNLPDPDPSIATGDYLSRYWVLDNSNITAFSCGLNFTFTDADVNGTKANLYCVRSTPDMQIFDAYASGNQLTGTVTEFGRFTGANGALPASLIISLEGASDGAGGMTTTLPTFTSAFPHSQPYSGTPWFYSGTESVVNVPAGVVDWVYIELRQATDPSLADASTIFGKRAAFLKSDGTIVDLDGTSNVKFYNASHNPLNNVYAVIKHRNHLAIMSSAGVPSISGVLTYDFTDAGTETYGYPNGIKLVHGKWALIGGNGNADQFINTDDISFSWSPHFGEIDGYYSGDFGMDGNVNTDDISFVWSGNFGIGGSIGDHYSGGYRSMVP